MTVASRSWGETINSHGVFSIVVFLSGPFAFLFAGVTFGWYAVEGLHVDDERVGVDVARVGSVWLLYGLVWTIAILTVGSGMVIV